MRILHRTFPLYMTTLLLQVVTVTGNPTVDEKLFQFILQAPVYALMFWIIVMMSRDTRAREKERAAVDEVQTKAHAAAEERRDKHEMMLTEALVTERQRIDKIESEREKRDEVLTTSLQAFKQTTEALEQRTTHMIAIEQQTQNALFAIQQDMLSLKTYGETAGTTINQRLETVDKIFEGVRRLALQFPREASMYDFLTEMERRIMARIEQDCAEEKRATDEQPAAKITPIADAEDADALTPGKGVAA